MKRNSERGIALITALLVMLLITSLIVGFSWLVLSDRTMSGDTSQRERAFYGAEAGMEQLTSSLNNLFAQNYAPTDQEVNALVAAGTDPGSNPNTSANFQGITFVDPAVGTPGSGYNIAYTSTNGKTPDSNTLQITAGPYQGLTGLVTPYTLNVISQAAGGGEVKLQRTVQTVGIPMFEFGIFSQTDLSFFAGPPFAFGGRVATNGNLWLAEGPGNTLTLGDKVTAVGEVIRTNLSNGFATNPNYNGTVDVLTAPGSYRAMAFTEGSLTGTLGSGANPGWQNISIGTYHSYIRDGDLDPPQYTGANSTGATALNLEVATPAIGGTPVDLIRRPILGELAANAAKLGERYYANASLRILLSDNPTDITRLDCVTATPPVDLSQMAQPVAKWPAGVAGSLTVAEAGAAGTLIPLAASGAKNGTATGGYTAADGYWLPTNAPIVTGYIKIEAATSYGVPCASYVDVTNEILGLGYVGKNLYPQGTTPIATAAPYGTYGGTALPAPPAPAQLPVAVSGCTDPHPNAVIRLVRVRDNPSTGKLDDCGTTHPANLAPSDIWPNALFDAREGNPRDWCPDGSTGGPGGGGCVYGPAASGDDPNAGPTLGGVVYYVELDVNNLVRWFTGNIGLSGGATKDPNTAPNDFSVYFSDRRGNYYAAAVPFAGGWPPLSPSGFETGEYGWNDVVNPASQYGCPNNALDTGEDLDTTGLLYTYGAQAAQAPYPGEVTVPAAAAAYPSPLTTPSAYGAGNKYTAISSFGGVINGATPTLKPNWKCANPPYITTAVQMWPGWYATQPFEPRENSPLFFRRALKLVNGSVVNLGVCPNGVNCGLTIASENPVYIQGNFNCGSVGCAGFGAPYGAASVVTDSFTFLSQNWNDINSFLSTYNTTWRGGTSTNYRVAVAAGKGISFPQPAAYATYQDFGTDGGVHNFLRFVEGWNGTLTYRGSILSLYYNRQGSGLYKCCNTVYGPPTRGYNFDTDFLTPALLPPRTPMFRTVNTIGFTQYVLPSIQ